jgi:alpha-beta hydrolase superfamily lysophospholipase
MAIAMWRAGFHSLAIEFPAGESFAVYTDSLARLRQEYSKYGPVYVVGHSMGADIAFSTSGFERLAALGFPVEAALLEAPTLIGAGAWDQVHTRGTLKKAAGAAPLVISPYCDHSQESLDPYLVWRGGVAARTRRATAFCPSMSQITVGV